jgi:hypothetical protein
VDRQSASRFPVRDSLHIPDCMCLTRSAASGARAQGKHTQKQRSMISLSVA